MSQTKVCDCRIQYPRDQNIPITVSDRVVRVDTSKMKLLGVQRCDILISNNIQH